MTDPRCGTKAGYEAHTTSRTTPCQPCKRAEAVYRKQLTKRVYLARGPMLRDATGTRRRIQALCRMGWPMHEIGARLGVRFDTVHGYTRQRTLRLTTIQKVAAVYDELWDTPGPSQRARRHAERQGWAPPLAYDDDTIDDPRVPPRTGRAIGQRAPFDEVAIARAMRGDDVHLRPVERAEAVRRMTANGLSAATIAARLRVEKRSVQRLRNGSGPSQVAS